MTQSTSIAITMRKDVKKNLPNHDGMSVKDFCATMPAIGAPEVSPDHAVVLKYPRKLDDPDPALFTLSIVPFVIFVGAFTLSEAVPLNLFHTQSKYANGLSYHESHSVSQFSVWLSLWYHAIFLFSGSYSRAPEALT